MDRKKIITKIWDSKIPIYYLNVLIKYDARRGTVNPYKDTRQPVMKEPV